jgi:hypothetical protein
VRGAAGLDWLARWRSPGAARATNAGAARGSAAGGLAVPESRVTTWNKALTYPASRFRVLPLHWAGRGAFLMMTHDPHNPL